MKFNLSDFLELDTTALLAVNGGSDYGGGYSPPSNPSAGGGAKPSASPGTSSPTGRSSSCVTADYQRNHVFLLTKGTLKDSSQCSSGGGSCSGASDGTTVYPNPHYGTTTATSITAGNNNSSSGCIVSLGGSCSGINGDCHTGDNRTPDRNDNTDISHQICADESKEHCDIIAWNHAIDAGLNPSGKDGIVWDGNDYTVDQLFDEHYSESAMEFNSDCAGLEGFLFYDWDGADVNGEYCYNHMEFCKVNVDGQSYSYFNNNGYEMNER